MGKNQQTPPQPNISNAMVRTVMIALEVLFKTSGTDVRVHGIQNVPDQPVLYVVNHFTRMETVIMPYVIKKHLGKFPVSLADASFFTGRAGRILSLAGGVSTSDPDRDKILIRALLTGSNPVIIFPEGSMIKDKKIVERGKYLINTATGRRPPHTGAGRIALRSQFIREELHTCLKKGDRKSIAEIARHFHLDPADIDAILEKETFIVPVNITYYPVRAKDNVISKLINRFVDDVTARMEEEALVEGSMVTDGVDIDINLGLPIAVKKYLDEGKGIRRMLAEEGPHLDPAGLKYAAPFKKIYVKLMYEYMRAIYSMTTVNHDHLASYIISKYKRRHFAESDLKNRIYLAVEQLMKTGFANYHQSLGHDQIHLLTDDEHKKYENFMRDASDDGLLTRSEGLIIKNRQRFRKNFHFHTIRKDNIVLVLKNEIEPLDELTKRLDRLMLIPPGLVRRKIRNHFLDDDRRAFEQDYEHHYIHEESKPAVIGAPFLWRSLWRNRGVILVHGYMAAPEEIRPLAVFLKRKGYSVYAARLRGHGTAPEDLSLRSWPEWYESVNRAYIIMKNTVKSFAIIGFSTGAGVALLQAANKPDKFSGVVSINGPARLQDTSARFSPLVHAWNKMFSALRIKKVRLDYVANRPENPHINYTRNPVSGVYELGRLMRYVKGRLGDVRTPALVIQGSDDPVVNPVSGTEIFSLVGSSAKQLVQVPADHHGILRGDASEEVKEKVLMFLKDVLR